MGGCGNCGGDCNSCSGCGGGLTLNEGELQLLQLLGQVAFLPVARKMGEDRPIYCGDAGLTPEEYSLILQCLEKKGLISIDYSLPLKGFAGYGDYPLKGSIGLTAKGQQVLDILDIQGLS